MTDDCAPIRRRTDIAKFPVRREFACRRVRSALRRQPGSAALREGPLYLRKGPPRAGFCELGAGLPAPSLAMSGARETAVVSGVHLKYSRLPGSIYTAWPVRRCYLLWFSDHSGQKSGLFDRALRDGDLTHPDRRPLVERHQEIVLEQSIKFHKASRNAQQ
jgi:hypothetical protein